jgi:hypothetical protein
MSVFPFGRDRRRWLEKPKTSTHFLKWEENVDFLLGEGFLEADLARAPGMTGFDVKRT